VRAAAGLGQNRRQTAGIGGIAAAQILRFWGAQLSLGGQAQPLELLRLQFAQVARLLVEDQRAITDAADFFDKMADLLEHFAQFAVTAFD
jgi:hypothetical protein